MRDQVFFLGLASFLVGVFIRSFLFLNEKIIWIFLALSFVFLLAFFFVKNKKLIFIFVALLSFSLGVFRYHVKDINEPKNVFDDALGEVVTFEGVITREPDRRENNQRLVVLFEENNVLVTTELYPKYFYGDMISVKGTLEKPENFKTEIGKEFDYINYLGKDSIYYTVSFAETKSISDSHGNLLIGFLLKTKQKFLDVINKNIPPPQSSLLSGLLLGTKQSLGKNIEQHFIDTGLIHIVVLSGYNVTIVAEALMRTFSFLPLIGSTSFGVVSIIFFAIMTGAGATIVRASIMAIIALIARATGNAFNISRALALAGFLMVVQNPYILYFDLSFQLSFLATVGLIYLSPLFEKYFLWLPKKFGLREIASATIATQIFVLPFILYKMGNLSIIAPITNLLVLPLIPVTMLFGFLTGIFGLISSFIAFPFGFVANFLLKTELFIVKSFSSFSFASVSIQKFPLILVIIIYSTIFWVLYKYHKKQNNE